MSVYGDSIIIEDVLPVWMIYNFELMWDDLDIRKQLVSICISLLLLEREGGGGLNVSVT